MRRTATCGARAPSQLPAHCTWRYSFCVSPNIRWLPWTAASEGTGPQAAQPCTGQKNNPFANPSDLGKCGADVVVQLGAPRKVDRDGVLPSGHAHDGRRAGEQRGVAGKVIHAQRRAHDEQLQRRDAAAGLGGHAAAQRHDARQQACGMRWAGVTARRLRVEAARRNSAGL